MAQRLLAIIAAGLDFGSTGSSRLGWFAFVAFAFAFVVCCTRHIVQCTAQSPGMACWGVLRAVLPRRYQASASDVVTGSHLGSEFGFD